MRFIRSSETLWFRRLKTICVVLTMILAAAPLTAVGADALASDDYTQWKQADEEWNETAPWSGTSAGFMARSGCWITSISMLLRQYGLVSGDVEEFNPWVCAGELYDAGAITWSGDMVLRSVEAAYPGFSYVDSYGYSFSRLKELFDEGFACALLVKDGGHMVAVRDVLEDGTVEIMDPGWDRTTLDEWGGAVQIIVFDPSGLTPLPVVGDCVILSA